MWNDRFIFVAPFPLPPSKSAIIRQYAARFWNPRVAHITCIPDVMTEYFVSLAHWIARSHTQYVNIYLQLLILSSL